MSLEGKLTFKALHFDFVDVREAHSKPDVRENRTNERRAKMELKEAIVHCDEIIKKMDNCDCRKEHEELKEFLEELQEYEDTGLTPEQIQELKERDAAMEINEIHVDEYYCPACGAENNCDQGVVEDNFCPRCGQRLNMLRISTVALCSEL